VICFDFSWEGTLERISRSMVEMPVLEQTLQDYVAGALRSRSQRPTDLVEALRNEGYYPKEIEAALSGLLEDGSVVFGTDGLLHSVQSSEAAA
jgi:hypothetical protein